VEPNTAMHPLSRASAAAAGLDDSRFRLVSATAEALPFPDASFDTVVGASRSVTCVGYVL
jgi:ubiquinone/menaquinone biosynthesis C-methylase UbiE